MGMVCRGTPGWVFFLSVVTASPILSPSFTINFTETFQNYPGAVPTSGAWFYNYPERLWRADHNEPNSNNFCGCAKDTNASCSLIFSGTGTSRAGLYVDFPSFPEACCFLCSDSDGCSPLIPTWLSGANFTRVDDDGCWEYCEAGAVAEDCMSFPPSGAMPPCKYMESISAGGGSIIYHNLTFNASTYVPGPPKASVFELRPECSKNCPNPFPAKCGR